MGEIWMLWIFLVLLGAAGLAGLAAGEITHKRRLRQRVSEQFGKRPAEEYLLEKIPAFADLDGELPVDSLTWEDLDMDQVFRRVNGCQSAVGEQVLYWQLHRLKLLPCWEEFLDHLEKNQKEREALGLLLARLGKRRSHYGLPDFLFCPVEVPLFLGGALLLPWNLWVGGCVILLSLGWNLALYYLGKSRVQGDLEEMRSFSALLWTAQALAKACTFSPLRKRLTQGMECFRGLRGRLAVLGPRGSSDLELMGEYFHILTLRDLRLYRKALRLIKAHSQELRVLFETVGLMDAAIATLSLRVSLPAWCRPTYRKDSACEFAGLFHPLLANPVPNSGRLEKDILLTGSNASGKSTFLKALAVNAILGQSLATCAAEEDCFRPGQVVTSMAVWDDITAGESYFMAEVRSLKRLTDAARTGSCLLFIDEILRGTNTVERLAASQAVLEELHRRDCFCVAATHDLELTQRLSGIFHCYHFQEEFTGEGIVFDYKLRPGPSHTQNAIRLLDVLGFSQTTVRRAEELAGKGEHTL